MKTDLERIAFIKNPDNWQPICETGRIRTFVLNYKGFDAYRQDVLKEDGKWHKQFWHRFPPTGQPYKIDRRGFIEYLKRIDQMKPDMEEKA